MITDKRRLQHGAELFWCQTGTFGDGTHCQRVDWVMPWDYQPLFAVGHDQMPALPGHMVAEFLKYALGLTLTDAVDCWHKF